MFGSDWNVTNNNGFGNRDIYPTAPGATLGQEATGGAPSGRPGMVVRSNDEVAKAASIGDQGNIVIGGAVFFALVFGLMFFAKYLGNGDDFKSLKPSVYNVITIALAATAGIPILKYMAVKFPIPGVSSWVTSI